ncbi:4Fe-4S dicluster domain-containing protein [Candidatus Cloacimonadota bacterium]
MSKKILIDLNKFRDTEDGNYSYGECSYDFHPNNIGMKNIVEMAMLKFTCRKCEDAPCIEVCPEDALERDEFGIIQRASNLCVSCQSCVAVCPFGTLMNEVIAQKKSICDLCDFTDGSNDLKCMETAPEGAVVFTDMEADEEDHIHQLSEKILVKEIVWEKLLNNE